MVSINEAAKVKLLLTTRAEIACQIKELQKKNIEEIDIVFKGSSRNYQSHAEVLHAKMMMMSAGYMINPGSSEDDEITITENMDGDLKAALLRVLFERIAYIDIQLYELGFEFPNMPELPEKPSNPPGAKNHKSNKQEFDEYMEGLAKRPTQVPSEGIYYDMGLYDSWYKGEADTSTPYAQSNFRWQIQIDIAWGQLGQGDVLTPVGHSIAPVAFALDEDTAKDIADEYYEYSWVKEVIVLEKTH